jgi:hypothetical protein
MKKMNGRKEGKRKGRKGEGLYKNSKISMKTAWDTSGMTISFEEVSRIPLLVG